MFLLCSLGSLGGDEIGKAADIGFVSENHEEVLQILEHYYIERYSSKCFSPKRCKLVIR